MTRLSFFLVAALLWSVPPDGGLAPAPGIGADTASAQDDQGPAERRFVVVARKYAFTPGRIEVFQGDLIRIELRTEDIAHSFTIDSYRISKRVSPHHPITFEFRADHTGTFPIYCNLQIDDGCRRMKGELVVRQRP
jgi:heme/copper-type cytochrome/quinol oxidase subunit 2